MGLAYMPTFDPQSTTPGLIGSPDWHHNMEKSLGSFDDLRIGSICPATNRQPRMQRRGKLRLHLQHRTLRRGGGAFRIQVESEDLEAVKLRLA